MVDREAALQAATQDLSARFPVVPRATIHRLLVRCLAEYEDAPVQAFVPLLVRRTAEQRLKELEALPSGPAQPEPASGRTPAAPGTPPDPGTPAGAGTPVDRPVGGSVSVPFR
jgi:hypothetical protein